MGFLFEEKEDKNGKYAEITGYEGRIRHLLIPKVLENEAGESLPVRVIGSHAFDGRKDLQSVVLPETVHTLRSFSFFNSANLSHISLFDSIEEYYDGSFRQCRSLHKIDVHLRREGHFQILRDILGDSDRQILLHLTMEKGECALLFPGYVDKVRENTMARQIHDTIEGCGYSYRQTVGRGQIDFRLYDKQFQRVTYDAKEAAVLIALCRLRYPMELLDWAKEDYLRFLQEEGEFSISYLLEEAEEEWIRFYLSLEILSKEACEKAISLLLKQEHPELTALFLAYQEKHFPKKKEELFFDISDL